MRDPTEASTATHFPVSRERGVRRLVLVRRAPGPETPDGRSRAGAQLGMAVLLVGGGLFWIGVAAAAVLLLARV